jgi:hypothetical protein
MKHLVYYYKKCSKVVIRCLLYYLIFCFVGAVYGQTQPVDSIVNASPYRDKVVWSYSRINNAVPLPWTMFHPNTFASIPVTFHHTATSVGVLPPAGEHPRMFFSKADLPAFRQRIQVKGSAAYNAWMNLLAYANAFKMTYDEDAEYAKPDWMNGSFRIHGRGPLFRIGGYKDRENYYEILASGNYPSKAADWPKSEKYPVMQAASCEALRCIVEDDADAAKKLAKVLVTATKMEQERRAANDKPVLTGQPQNPSTSRMWAIGLGMSYDFIYPYMTPEQRKFLLDELVTLSANQDNYGTFNNADFASSNWATFSYWTFDAMAIEGDPGFNDLKFRGLYRGIRNFMTIGYLDSGAIYEGEGKSLMALDAVAAIDRAAPKYGLQLLSQHPVIQNHFGNFTALSVLPTQKNFALLDIIGGMGKDLCTPIDVVMAKYFYPNDPKIDFVYRTVVHDDYSNFPNRVENNWNGVVICAIFARDYNPAKPSPQSIGLPLSFFCGQRALMMTRSSWDEDASFLTMHVRGASGGHSYRDRNGIMFAAKGRPWITIPYHNGETQGWACSTVLIDKREQSNTTPSRVVDYVDNKEATFMVGDAKYCWDWVWDIAANTTAGKPATFADLAAGNVDYGAAWKPVENSFNDFAYTKKLGVKRYSEPLKMTAHWIYPDGYIQSRKRQVNTPVIKSYRTSGIVRGKHPYTLVIDDIQRNCMPARYDWNITLMTDVIQLSQLPSGCQRGDIVLTGKDDVNSGSLKAQAPALLIRVLQQNGKAEVPQLVMHNFAKENINVLTLSTMAVSPDYKVLIYPFKEGEELPKTSWNANHTAVSLSFSDQKDLIAFAKSSCGKSNLKISRGGQILVDLNKEPEPLNDLDTETLNVELSQLPAKLSALKGFATDTIKGLIASWTLDKIEKIDNKLVFRAEQPNVPAISVTGTVVEKGVIGNAARFAEGGTTIPYLLNQALPNRNNFTLSFWVKSDLQLKGTILNVNGNRGIAFDFSADHLRCSTQGVWGFGGLCSASALTAWTHIAFTSDQNFVCLYRDGMLLMKTKRIRDFDFNSGIRLAQKIYLDSGVPFSGCMDDIRIFNRALEPSTIEALCLYGNYASFAPKK